MDIENLQSSDIDDIMTGRFDKKKKNNNYIVNNEDNSDSDNNSDNDSFNDQENNLKNDSNDDNNEDTNGMHIEIVEIESNTSSPRKKSNKRISCSFSFELLLF